MKREFVMSVRLTRPRGSKHRTCGLVPGGRDLGGPANMILLNVCPFEIWERHSTGYQFLSFGKLFEKLNTVFQKIEKNIVRIYKTSRM